MQKNIEKLNKILSVSDIIINGSRPWDPQIKNPRAITRALSEGSVGVGESYMDGDWECEDMSEFFRRVSLFELTQKISPFSIMKLYLKAKIFNLQNKKLSFIVGQKHYDVGNDLYDVMLDKSTKSYTCGYWKNAQNLDEAQIAKLDLICKKLELKKGDRVLDIGCGWGNFMIYAVKNYGVECVGLTVSIEQKKQGEEFAKGMPIEFILTDYRDFNDTEKFNKIVSIGMFEHVGVKNYESFMNVAQNNLKDDGLFLLHTIGAKNNGYHTDGFMNKYILHNSYVPGIDQIAKAFQGKFVMEDWHNFGAYYDLTLMEWWKNFDKNHLELSKNNPKYDTRFYRMWKLYLLSMAGWFRGRGLELWQIVLSKKGVPGGYNSIR